MRRIWTIPVALSAWLAADAAQGALPVTIRDINPNQSTLAADPDGASGGRVNGLGVDRSTPGTLYAASEQGGLFKSTDNGQIWSHLDGHVPTLTWDVEVDPQNSNRVFATSFYDGRVNSRSGINVSLDGGVTWAHPVSATPPAGFCLAATQRTELAAFGISVDPANPNRVFAGTNCGLAISADRGATWTFVDPTPADGATRVIDVAVHDGGIIDVCGDDGHLRSTTGGSTWTTAPGIPLPSGTCSLAVSPDEPYVLFAVVGTSIFESDDGGQSWPVTYANPSPQGRIPFLATNQRSGATYDLWFGDVRLHRGTCTTPAPANPGGAQRCNASAAWAGPFTRTSGAHDDSGDIAFAPGVATNACPILFSSDGGVFRNTIAASPGCHTPFWAQPTVTPHALWNWDLAGVSRAGAVPEDLYMGNQDNGSFGTTNGGALTPAWTNERCCDGFDVAGESTRVLNTICCFGGGRSTRLFLSGPGMIGASPEIGTYPPGNLLGFQQLDSIANFGPDDYAVITDEGVFVTSNVAASPIAWTEIGAANTPSGACGIQVAFTGGSPIFFVKSFGCNGDSPGTLWRYQGTAPGGNWQQVATPGPGSFGVYAVDRNDPQRIIASHLGGAGGPEMVLTQNGGTTWNNLPALDKVMTGAGAFQYQNSAYPQPTLVAFDPGDADIVVAGGADSGVFLSMNGGTRWALVTDPNEPGASGTAHIPRPRYAHFDHDPPGGDINLFLGTQGRGAWKLTFKKTLMPEIQVPEIGDLADTCAGSDTLGALKVCNTSLGELVVDAITSSNPVFSVAPPSGGYPVRISHDFCFPFSVKFTPTATGPQSATLVISSNDPSFPILEVAARGAGTQTDIRVTGSTDFGVVSAWSPAEKVVSVCNTGACDLAVASASLGCTDFSLINNPFPATVSHDSCLDLVVGFPPALPTRHHCDLTITSNDPDTPNVIRTLTARTPAFFSLHAGLVQPHGVLGNVAKQGSTFNLDFLYPIRPRLAWDLRLGVSKFDGRAGSPDTDVWALSPNIRFTVNPASPVRFLLNGGVGGYHFDPGNFEAGANLGLGLNVPAGPRFAIEATYNHHWVFTASPTLRFSQTQVGVLISF
jgi:hypothetical protein